MSWIDIFLSKRSPEAIYGADAERALKGLQRWRHLPLHLVAYRKAQVPWKDAIRFLLLDLVRIRAYRRGFRRGLSSPKDHDQQ